MAFNLFKKKEVIKDINKDKVNNDIVEDFGNFIKNNNNEIPISSFDSNFNEEIINNNSITTMPDIENTTLNIKENPIDDMLMSQTNIDNNSTNFDNNVDITYNIGKNTEEIEESNEIENNSTPDINNINNYDYNPIINNLEHVQNNIKNSQDINIALSNLHKSKKTDIEQDLTILEDEINQDTTSIDMTSQYMDMSVDPGYKICPKCGQRIREDYKECFVCGTKL